MYIAKRQDGTFETLVNGYPYHVVENDPLFAEFDDAHKELAPGMAIVGEMKVRQVTKTGSVTTVDDDGVEHVETAEQVENEEYLDGGVVLEDNRNRTGWLNGEAFSMREFGPLPKGFSDTPPTEQLAAAARAERDRLLAATDYLIMPDYPISDEVRAAVAAYRQALRDITKQAGFPADIVWPDSPEIG